MWCVLMASLLAESSSLETALELERQGAPRLALAALEKLVMVDPTAPLPRLEAARLALKVGTDLERAGWHADIARSLTPENPRAHFLFALTADEAGSRVEAIRALEVALALRADFDEARARLGGLLLSVGDWATAARVWREVLARTPGSTTARFSLADALERQGAVTEATRELHKLMQVPQVRVAATRRLVAVLQRAGKRDEAERLSRTLERPTRALRPLQPSAR